MRRAIQNGDAHADLGLLLREKAGVDAAIAEFLRSPGSFHEVAAYAMALGTTYAIQRSVRRLPPASVARRRRGGAGPDQSRIASTKGRTSRRRREALERGGARPERPAGRADADAACGGHRDRGRVSPLARWRSLLIALTGRSVRPRTLRTRTRTAKSRELSRLSVGRRSCASLGPCDWPRPARGIGASLPLPSRRSAPGLRARPIGSRGGGSSDFGSYRKPSDVRRTSALECRDCKQHLLAADVLDDLLPQAPRAFLRLASRPDWPPAPRIGRSPGRSTAPRPPSPGWPSASAGTRSSFTRGAGAQLPHLTEPIVHDHFEAFIGRQDRALGIGTAVGAESMVRRTTSIPPRTGESGRRPDRKPTDRRHRRDRTVPTSRASNARFGA